jgi:hypothetical protein
MTFISYKYEPTGGRDRIPNPDFKSCLIWFIAFVFVVAVIVVLSLWVN